MSKWTFISVAFLILLAGNVYQYWNPVIIELPSGQQEIDTGAWVQRSTYVSRGMLLDSLRSQNSELANRIRDNRDRIANLTFINGRLNIVADSLREEVNSQPINFDWVIGEPVEPKILDFNKIFGDNLFQVESQIIVWPDSVQNHLDLFQIRDINLTVTNTMSDDRSRMLTYVNSNDFVNLEYQTYTELSYKSRTPVFLYGLAGGILITVILL